MSHLMVLKLIVLLIITKIGARCRTLRANFVFASALEKTANVRMRLHLRLVVRCARSAFAHSLRDDFPCLLRKEVIQPLVPERLPCEDFIPVATHALGRRRPDFGGSRLSWCDGRCVQGPGTYSPRHADPRLLAIPTSRGRVAAHDPN